MAYQVLSVLSIADVIECMACSDNVVRAGLTKKYKDKQTLCDMLTYQSKTLDQFQVHPRLEIGNEFCEIYDPPTPEYTVARIAVPLDVDEVTLPAVNGMYVNNQDTLNTPP